MRQAQTAVPSRHREIQLSDKESEREGPNEEGDTTEWVNPIHGIGHRYPYLICAAFHRPDILPPAFHN